MIFYCKYFSKVNHFYHPSIFVTSIETKIFKINIIPKVGDNKKKLSEQKYSGSNSNKDPSDIQHFENINKVFSNSFLDNQNYFAHSALGGDLL